ncbi:hypothetical protein B0J18DRAFT_481190 [Chaetomium sp. MPI-SDFR-AT-0129]|nr:hypothetical protein B0J18DRAFT_481190 [Chaetomium sp. MPI-SDFR-AT-0129]
MPPKKDKEPKGFSQPPQPSTPSAGTSGSQESAPKYRLQDQTASPPNPTPLPVPQPVGQDQRCPPTTPLRQDPSEPPGNDKQGKRKRRTSPKTPENLIEPEASTAASPVADNSPPSKLKPPPSDNTLLPPPQLAEARQTTTSRPPPTIIDAFEQALPPVRLATDFGTELGGHESSMLVKSTVPPPFWIARKAEHYLELADRYLSTPKVRAYLSNHYLPSLEPTFRVRREADVVTFTATHLTHAANLALGGAVFPGEVEMLSEYQRGQCRPDCIWRLDSTGGDENSDDDAVSGSGGRKQNKQQRKRTGPVFAVLELKITGAFNVCDFDNSKVEESNLSKRNPKRTQIEGEILSPMKQITTYGQSENFDTQYVACFDGRTLFLGVLLPGPESTTAPFIRGTVLSCQGGLAENGKGHEYARKALLGWLIEARLEQRADKNHHVPRKLEPRPLRQAKERPNITR